MHFIKTLNMWPARTVVVTFIGRIAAVSLKSLPHLALWGETFTNITEIAHKLKR